MALLCGVDMVFIPGIKNIKDDASRMEKFFDPSELNHATLEHLAGIIAAKEAFFKAVDMFPKFRDVLITYKSSGKPHIVPSPAFGEYKSIDVSISHDKDYAVAFVVIEKG